MKIYIKLNSTNSSNLLDNKVLKQLEHLTANIESQIILLLNNKANIQICSLS